MLSDITLGQYIPGRSCIHKLDPRLKIVLTTAIIVFVFVASNFISMAIVVGIVLLSIAVSNVPLNLYFKSMKAIIFIVLFTAVLNLFYGKGTPIFQLGFMQITMDGIYRAIFIAIRIITLILSSAVLTYTTSPTQLTDALERLLAPLKKVKVPVHDIAMMMTIALRFVPTLLEETDKIMSAQKARGADLESGGLMQRVKALIPILIPLFVSAFRRAFDLAMAMDCRCYNGKVAPTKMKQMHMNSKDWKSLALICALLVSVVICNSVFPPIGM